MKRRNKPTDLAHEQALKRVALWLDVGDLRWLAQHCSCPPNAPQEVTDRCLRIHFRANAALHKARMAENDAVMGEE